MGYNPRIHGTGEHAGRKRPRHFDPRAGARHTTVVGQRGPVGISPVDIQNKVSTSSGWRISYYEGDTFEVYYELICARNSIGRVKHPSKDRCVRVLSGKLFIVSDGKIDSAVANQVCSFPKNVEYEFASSGESDVEILVIQESGYAKDLEQITPSEAVNSHAVTPFLDHQPSLPKVSSERAEAEAARLREARMTKNREKRQRSPVPKRVNDTTPVATMPTNRPALTGQQVVGVNPRPIGAGGFRDE